VFLRSSENAVTNGESDFESRGFTEGYEADYISVQCVGETLNAVFVGTYERSDRQEVSINGPR
jgi:hypothetical protein